MKDKMMPKAPFSGKKRKKDCEKLFGMLKTPKSGMLPDKDMSVDIPNLYKK